MFKQRNGAKVTKRYDNIATATHQRAIGRGDTLKRPIIHPTSATGSTLLQHAEITLDKKTTETSVEELMDLVANEYSRDGKPAGNRGQSFDELNRV